MSQTLICVFITLLINIIYGQQTCYLTPSDVLGPYYLSGAPKSLEQLCENSPAHDRLILTGKIVDYDSKCTIGVPYAKLDLWQVSVFQRGKDLAGLSCIPRQIMMASIREVNPTKIGFVAQYFKQMPMEIFVSPQSCPAVSRLLDVCFR